MPADNGELSKNINGLDLDIKGRLRRPVNWDSSVLPALSPESIFPVIGRRMKNNGPIAEDLFSMETFLAIIKLSDALMTMCG